MRHLLSIDENERSSLRVISQRSAMMICDYFILVAMQNEGRALRSLNHVDIVEPFRD